MSVFKSPYKRGYSYWYPSRKIHARTSYNGCPWDMNIHEWISISILWISVLNYSCFIDTHVDFHWFLWISTHGLAWISTCDWMDSRSRKSMSFLGARHCSSFARFIRSSGSLETLRTPVGFLLSKVLFLDTSPAGCIEATAVSACQVPSLHVGYVCPLDIVQVDMFI